MSWSDGEESLSDRQMRKRTKHTKTTKALCREIRCFNKETINKTIYGEEKQIRKTNGCDP